MFKAKHFIAGTVTLIICSVPSIYNKINHQVENQTNQYFVSVDDNLNMTEFNERFNKDAQVKQFKLSIDGKKQNIKKSDFKRTKIKDYYQFTFENNKINEKSKINYIFNVNLILKDGPIEFKPIKKQNQIIIESTDKDIMKYINEIYIKN